ncbi:MAG TPA: polysaccharide pyruvyl transferase family protein [Candidatus Absconditabacterales bacterium]|nr:polysaccharide pyruvyl transferase family protein [Candidatus Absconditabacterales bacterium]
MKLYLKGFYGYKNFGDEMLLFGLLNYLQAQYNPELIAIEVGDKKRMEHRIRQNHDFLDTGIRDKIELVPNAVVSKRFKQFQSFLGFDKYKKYFKVFGGGEVLDESRRFPHNGWNLVLLHHYSIRKHNFVLVGGIGTDEQKSTKRLYKYILPRAQKIICREEGSVKIAKKYSKKNVLLHKDFSESALSSVVRNGRNAVLRYSLRTEKFILINIGPKYYTPQNIQKIADYCKKYTKSQKIFFPGDINFDKQYYHKLRKIIPDLEIYDWTKHSLSDTLKLFQDCQGGIGSRLHFLYPLKILKKDFVSISTSNKVQKMI